MKKIILILVLLFGFNLSAKAEFISTFDDIPLQVGLKEEDNLYFDVEDVRIIEQYLSSTSVTKESFLKFYKTSLNSLGWKLQKEYENTYIFKREDEGLTITIQSSNPLIVLFTLKPYGK